MLQRFFALEGGVRCAVQPQRMERVVHAALRTASPTGSRSIQAEEESCPIENSGRVMAFGLDRFDRFRRIQRRAK